MLDDVKELIALSNSITQFYFSNTNNIFPLVIKFLKFLLFFFIYLIDTFCNFLIDSTDDCDEWNFQFYY